MSNIIVLEIFFFSALQVLLLMHQSIWNSYDSEAARLSAEFPVCSSKLFRGIASGRAPPHP